MHPFPQRGVLDEYREGQEDEGEAPAGKSWSDREELSSASEGSEGTLLCAGGEIPAVGEATTVEEGEVAEKLRQIRDMMSQAKELGHPRVVMTLQRAEHTLKRQLLRLRNVDSGATGAARTARLLEEESVQAARKGLAAARLIREEARRAASSAEARLRASRTFQLECRRLRKRRAETVALAAHGQPPPRAFDATDLGQGRKMAGGPSFQRTRRCLWRRIVELFPELPDAVRAQEERTWRLWDEAGVRRLGSAWGHIYRDEMLKLKHAAEARDKDALVRFLRAVQRDIPKVAITL